MKLLRAGYILLCDSDFSVVRDGGILFSDKIIAVGAWGEILERAKGEFGGDFEILNHENDIALPGLLNLHTHLEFSANKTALEYGDFIVWLSSVIKNREIISDEAKNAAIKREISTLLNSGVSTIGEISSFGKDLEICANAPGRFIFFNEILGSNEAILEQNWENFLRRFLASKEFSSDLFIPAISVHSPYSTHKILTQKAVKFAKENGLLMSVHFLESQHELAWLNSGGGEFGGWLGRFSKNPVPFYTPGEFLAEFLGLRTLFIHCVFAEEFFASFDKNLHSVVSCAVSNRLLGKRALNLSKIHENALNIALATDGLSSNNSLNIWDEMRAFLLCHAEFNAANLAKMAILSVTKNAALAAGLNLGEIAPGKIADIAVFSGFGEINPTQIALALILHTKNAKKLFIKGELCKV